jgi:uncharacterized protein YebE (UPF0316 family)
MIFQYLLFLVLGVVECFGTTLNTKFVQRDKKLPSFITSFINILVWAFVLSTLIESMGKSWDLIIVYGLGYASGDVLGIMFENYLEKLAKLKGFWLKKKKKSICMTKRKKR